ncbi:hypothetical protein V8E52_004722 [Russula decolorans]
MSESSTSTSISHCPESASPAVTEITYDISHIEQLPEERVETLRAAGIKVRDFAYEPMPNSSKAPEIFDPVPYKNRGLLRPKALFRLINMGWLTLTDVGRYFNPYDYIALAHYDDKPDEQRYPFVAVSQNESIPTPSQLVGHFGLPLLGPLFGGLSFDLAASICSVSSVRAMLL